jgi:hypothetical protein
MADRLAREWQEAADEEQPFDVVETVGASATTMPP